MERYAASTARLKQIAIDGSSRAACSLSPADACLAAAALSSSGQMGTVSAALNELCIIQSREDILSPPRAAVASLRAVAVRVGASAGTPSE
jgi:hypothetical protein